ncbi:Type I restriction modification DNA specificity domain-containing protein [Nitrosomonas nitrosa]|uniref:Type I restriction modification DNA specificity domain-containing protein n=2 Tax=Nitrosomonas nitrosa TaxID=52442 RepID=A0A1I4TIF2_9PROT|nr:Type I restriction modification DNA specificity domain-containing protein [Nitrosomonas nitrosa]
MPASLLMKEFILKLADIVTVSSGHPFRGKIPEKPGSGIYAIQMKDVSPEDGVCWDSVIETELTGKKQPDWLAPGDILFVARGSFNYAVLIEEMGKQAICAPHFYILRVTNPSLLPAFLVWQLNQRPLQNYFDRVAEGSVTKSIRRSILEHTEITVPTIEKQNQILGLYKTIMREKKLYAELISNADKLMHALACDLTANKTLQTVNTHRESQS